MLDNGFSTLIHLAGLTTGAGAVLFEREITPPAVDGGEAIDVTTMHNTTFKTKAPGALLEIGDVAVVCGYKSTAYADIMAQVNVNQQIRLEFPDGEILTFWGFLKSFTPTNMTINGMPIANCVIVVSNLNESGVETGPT